MRKYDVTIIGAGLAGLCLAKRLAEADFRVLLVDRKADLSKGVHTTGIFVRKTFEDFDFPPSTLGRSIRRVSLYSPSLRRVELVSGAPEFRVGRMGLLYRTILNECKSLGVDFLSSTRYIHSKPARRASNLLTRGGHTAESGSVVALERRGKRSFVETKVLVGGDGACSAVAADLGLDGNREWIVGYEEVRRGTQLGAEPELHCFLDSNLSPGYLAWIANDGEEVHIGVGGYPRRFDPRSALKLFKKKVTPRVFDLDGTEQAETRGGRIPVGGVLRRIASRRGLLIGDAAGAVSPLTAGGLDPCLRLSQFASAVINERLCEDDPDILLRYSGAMFRRRFRKRLLLRSALKAARAQFLLEAGFEALNTGIGRRVAEEVFFRRASFPDVPERRTAHARTIVSR